MNVYCQLFVVQIYTSTEIRWIVFRKQMLLYAKIFSYILKINTLSFRYFISTKKLWYVGIHCSITSLTKVSEWGSQYHLNRNLGPYFHLGQGMLSQNPSPLTLLSFLLSPFLSRPPSRSAQSAEIVEVAGNDPRAGEEEASCWRDSRYKTRVLTAGHFLANTWRCIRRIKLLF